MSRLPIQDEFTNLPISRQRKYQLRKQKAGLCAECGKPAASGSRCAYHLIAAREYNRQINGSLKRYKAFSYAIEAAGEASPVTPVPSQFRGPSTINHQSAIGSATADQPSTPPPTAPRPPSTVTSPRSTVPDFNFLLFLLCRLPTDN